jgi:hypothetical protein
MPKYMIGSITIYASNARLPSLGREPARIIAFRRVQQGTEVREWDHLARPGGQEHIHHSLT